MQCGEGKVKKAIWQEMQGGKEREKREIKGEHHTVVFEVCVCVRSQRGQIAQQRRYTL